MITPRFSLAHLTALPCRPPELIYLAARAGYDDVGLRPIPVGTHGEPVHDLVGDLLLRKQTRAALAATGVGLNDIELCRIHDGMDPRRYLPAFEVAAELGARHVVSSVWTPDRSYAQDMFAEVCDLAAEFELTVNLEYVPIAAVDTLAGAVDLLRATATPNAGLLLDAYHVHRSRTRLEDLDRLPRDWFHVVHLCDAPARVPDSLTEIRDELRERRLYPGEGGIDLAGLLHRLPRVVHALEVPHLARLTEYGAAEHAARCLEATRAYLAAHPRPVAA